MNQMEITWINVETGSVPTQNDLSSGKGKFSVCLTYQNQFYSLLNGKERKIVGNKLQNESPVFYLRVRGQVKVHK